jgi:hypothetical protein
MSTQIRAERPDGGLIAFDPEKCIAFPVRGDGASVETLYFDPSDRRAIHRKQFWVLAVKNNLTYPLLADGPCRVVTIEEARELLLAAKKVIPPEFIDQTPPVKPASGRKLKKLDPDIKKAVKAWESAHYKTFAELRDQAFPALKASDIEKAFRASERRRNRQANGKERSSG